MSSDPATVALLTDRLVPLAVHSAALFGEYALYCDDKVIGLICDDTLYLAPVGLDAELLAPTEPAPPPGRARRDYHRVPGYALEDLEWLKRVVQATANALPPPEPRTPRPTPPERVPHPRRPTR
ncbi:TfoX/Sxy family protein [Planctomonas psychrotolerans]|uniref:TfoX/Sxy family protein n=1 Tax=Planctomonas psychrotolerans TaxID=2528712 RepID=UPI001D0D2761|nr:TfoX/Sxy family protein [Planctomonas psychrotolerans]